MCNLSYLDFVEQQYVAWERAALESLGGYLLGSLRVLPFPNITGLIEGDAPDTGDDYGILPGPEGGDAFDPWVLGFVNRDGVAL